MILLTTGIVQNGYITARSVFQTVGLMGTKSICLISEGEDEVVQAGARVLRSVTKDKAFTRLENVGINAYVATTLKTCTRVSL